MAVEQGVILEALAREIGAITVNNNILTLELEQANEMLKEQATLIESLRARIANQDADMKVLREEVVTLRPKENIPPSQRNKTKR